MNKSFKVNYLARDFSSIKEELKKYAARYYTNSLADLSESSINSFLIESVAYVGDVLSYYLDFQTNETFLANALEEKNVLKLAKSLGYKLRDNASTCGKVAVYMIIPSKSGYNKPDFSKVPIIKKGTQFSSDTDTWFVSTDDVSITENMIGKNYVVARTNAAGNPTHYAIKTYIPIVSGRIRSVEIAIGNFVKFNKVPLNNSLVAEILSVYDADGNEYYEVSNLSQNIVYKAVPNSDEYPKFLLKKIPVQRRFVFDRDESDSYIIFGGKQYKPDEDISLDPIAEPSKFILNRFNNDFIENEQFDPNMLLNGDNFGIGPDNTTLIIKYRENNYNTNNANISDINKISRLVYEFNNLSSVNAQEISDIISSMQVINEENIIGENDFITLNEVKDLAGQIFSSQGRAVTAKDYETLSYMMPQKYGFIKRVKAERDRDSIKNNINLYISCVDSEGYLTQSNTKLKENLKSWISDYKIITDGVDILDAKIINLGVEFTIKADPMVNKFEVLNLVKSQLRTYFSYKPDIGQSLSILDIYKEIRKISSVLDVVDLKIVNKNGITYSKTYFNVKENMSNDGNYVKIPRNAIYEIKYLNENSSDIIGNVI